MDWLIHPTAGSVYLQQGTTSHESLLPGSSICRAEILHLRNRTPLEKLMVPQLVRKSNAFTETKWFIKFSQPLCPYPEPDESSPRSRHPVFKVNLNIIPHLRLGPQSGFFPSCFPTKTQHIFLFSTPRTCCMPRLCNLPRLGHLSNISCGVQIINIFLCIVFYPLQYLNYISVFQLIALN